MTTRLGILALLATLATVSFASPPASAQNAQLSSEFVERFADAALDRLYAPPGSARRDTALAALGTTDEAKMLVGKLASASKGANPFSPDGGAFERALAAFFSVEQVTGADPVTAEIEQRKRCERALDLARGSGSNVLVAHGLTWLGRYAMQGGDVIVARRYLGEAASLAESAGLARYAIAARRGIARTYALDGDLATALVEARSAERDLALPSVPVDLGETGPELYAELTDYAARAGLTPAAAGYAKRRADLLIAHKVPAADCAEALERAAQLFAQAVADDPAAAATGAEQFVRAADLRDSLRQRDHAIVDLTAAGVLLVENAHGAAARAPLERAASLAAASRDEVVRAGVSYWIGRSYVSDAERLEGAAAGAARDRAIALFESALGRLRTGRAARAVSAPAMKATLHLWAGKALADRAGADRPKLARALEHFRSAFEVNVTSGDINEAVACAELVIRTTVALGDSAGAGRAAEDLYDRLASTGRIDPVNAARPLGRQVLESIGSIVGAEALPAQVVSFFDHVSVSLAAAPGGRASIAEASLIESAATRGDTALVAARADRCFEALVAAGLDDEALTLADTVRFFWTDRDVAQRTVWIGRCEKLAGAAYDKAIADKKPDVAIRAAGQLADLARLRGDDESLAKWRSTRAELTAQEAERLESSGKTGLASDAWRTAAGAARAAGDLTGARSGYDRAVKLADKSTNVEARALALAERAVVERELNDINAARDSATRALADLEDLAAQSTQPRLRDRYLERAAALRAFLGELGAVPAGP